MKINLKKLHNDAVVPQRAHPTDIGYDLTAISIKKIFDNGVVLYGTGLSVQPDDGYYTEIIPRSSASKTDMILANGIGIIDPSYTGELFIAVRHLTIKTSDIETKESIDIDNSKRLLLVEPFNKFQLIMRKAYNYDIKIVNELNNTDRGSGGFGSTG